MAFNPSTDGVVVPVSLIEQGEANRFAAAAQSGSFLLYDDQGAPFELNAYCLFGRWCDERALSIIILNGGVRNPLNLEQTWPDPLSGQVSYPGVSDGDSAYETHQIPACADSGPLLPNYPGNVLYGIGQYGFHIPGVSAGQPSDPLCSGAVSFACADDLPSIGIAWKLTIGGDRLVAVTADTSQYSSLKRFYELTVDSGSSKEQESGAKISIWGKFGTNRIIFVWLRPT